MVNFRVRGGELENCKCTKEGELATLKTEIEIIKLNQGETRDLIIIVTKLVEQFEATKNDVKAIKDDMQVLKEKPLTAYTKITWMILGVLVTYLVNKMLGIM